MSRLTDAERKEQLSDKDKRRYNALMTHMSSAALSESDVKLLKHVNAEAWERYQRDHARDQAEYAELSLDIENIRSRLNELANQDKSSEYAESSEHVGDFLDELPQKGELFTRDAHDRRVPMNQDQYDAEIQERLNHFLKTDGRGAGLFLYFRLASAVLVMLAFFGLNDGIQRNDWQFLLVVLAVFAVFMLFQTFIKEKHKSSSQEETVHRDELYLLLSRWERYLNIFGPEQVRQRALFRDFYEELFIDGELIEVDEDAEQEDLEEVASASPEGAPVPIPVMLDD